MRRNAFIGNSVIPAGSVTFFSCFCPDKLNLVHEEGMVSSVMPTFNNASIPMVSRPSGKSNVVNELQPSREKSSKVFNELGSVREDKDVQLKKQKPGITSIPSGMAILSSLSHL